MAKTIIDRKNKTITNTKAFNAKASIYGTPEYEELTKIQNQNQGFRIVVQTPHRNNIPLSRITYEQMEKYIKTHDDENKSVWNEYLKLRGKSDNNEIDNEDEIQVKISVSFFEVKKWFSNKYSHFTEEAEARKREIKKLLGKEAM